MMTQKNKELLPKDLLKYIEAPSTLEDSSIIIPRLLGVLRIIEQMSDQEKLYESVNIQGWIKSCESLIQDNVKEVANEKVSVPLRGLYNEHQPYVTLRYIPDNQNLRAKHDLLLAQLLIANHLCRELEADGDLFESSRKTAFTFARSISKPSNESTLQELPLNNCSQTKYLELLKGILNQPRISSFIVFIKYAQGLRKGITRESGEGHLKYPPKSRNTLETEVDEGQPETSIDQIKLPIHSPSKEHDAEQSGLSSHELTARVEFSSVSFDNQEPMNGRSSKEHVIRSKSYSKQLSMLNQNLMYRWSVLSDYEADCFVLTITEMLRKINKNSRSYLENMEPLIILSVMFWFGIPLEKVLSLKGFSSEPDILRGDLIFICSPKPYLLVKSAKPNYKCRYERYDTLDNSTHIRLSTGLNIEQYILQYFKENKNKRLFFTKEPNEYQPKIKKILTMVNQQYGCRLTINRVSSFMFEKVASFPNSDITYAMIITGRASYVGFNLIYYTVVNYYKLLSIYQAVCLSIARSINFSKNKLEDRKFLKPIEVAQIEQKFGAKFNPSIIDVSHLKDHLLNELHFTRKKGSVIDVHNALTYYTSALINFSTGYRAVGDASFQFEDIDEVTGLAVISDKDSVDEYHSRLVWLPEICLNQIKAYTQHLHVLLEYSSVRLPKIYKALSQHLLDSEGKQLPGLFLIDGDKISAFTPKKYEASFPDSFAFPANVHRHFLRTRLLDTGCLTDVINAFMGHWENGQEPWAKFSSLSPLEYKEVISPYIESLLEEAGWSAVNPECYQ